MQLNINKRKSAILYSFRYNCNINALNMLHNVSKNALFGTYLVYISQKKTPLRIAASNY
jgi:hypothetical protein